MSTKDVALDLRWRLQVIGLSSSIAEPMAQDIEKWNLNSGSEWTVSRLKSLKVDLFRIKAKMEPLTWVRKNRKGKVAGWLGILFDWADGPYFNKALQSLMAYTYFVSPRLTAKQKDKTLSGIQSEESFIPQDLVDKLKSTTVRAIGSLSIIPDLDSLSLLVYRGSPSKRSPIVGERSVPQNESISKEFNMLHTPWGLSLYERFRNQYCGALSGMDSARRQEASWHYQYGGAEFGSHVSPCSDPSQIWGGTVHMLQEPGYKCRTIASPYRLHQIALKPLGDKLFEILKTLPWDCTFDQQKAHPNIQEALRKGKTVHCVDLSSATDYFPLSLQLEVLKTIFGENDYINLFHFLSRSNWKSNELGTISWTRGQPMGLYPSFPSFGLTHGLLLLMLSNGEYHGQFFVVGDDIVILNDSLAKAYKNTLDLLECPYSPDKTISSDTFAEFAGKIITSQQVFPQLKWRKMSDDNFLDLMCLLGEKGRALLTPRQKIVYDKVAKLLPPWGCNHSGGDNPLSDATFQTLEFIQEYGVGKKTVESVVDLAAWITHKHGFQDDGLWPFISRDVHKIINTFDEKVKRAFSPTVVGGLVSSAVSLAKLFPDLSEVSGKPILPTLEFTSARTSTLDWYEALLRIK